MLDLSEPISLIEYVPKFLPKDRIEDSDGQRLWQNFHQFISVDSPSFKNENHWELTSQGVVGFIPVSEKLRIYIAPKVPLKNLFGMWEYAYRLKSFHILSELFESDSLQEFYSQLANILAKRVYDRSRKGYYRAYIPKTEDLSFIKGKLDINRMITSPWIIKPRCSYQENTADVEENQILCWTLHAILRSGFCNSNTLPTIRNAYRNISHSISLQPFKGGDCIDRLYNRLNDDYQPLHALCRFFLENSGPSVDLGDRKMLPFIVNMAQLYQLFIAEWLKAHLPPAYSIEDQETVNIDEGGKIQVQIDIVLYEKATKQPLCVLDTKYKAAETPSPGDLGQIALYALVKKCNRAILVYPDRLMNPLNKVVKDIRFQSATFSLQGDLEGAGQEFMDHLLQKVEQLKNEEGLLTTQEEI